MVDSAVRAMTWNIWWRFGPRWQDRQPGIRQTLAPGSRCGGPAGGLGELGDDAGRRVAAALGLYAVSGRRPIRRRRPTAATPTTRESGWALRC